MFLCLPALAALGTWVHLFPPHTRLCVQNHTQRGTTQSAPGARRFIWFSCFCRRSSRQPQGPCRGTRSRLGGPAEGSRLPCSGSTVPWAGDSSAAGMVTVSAAGGLKGHLETLGQGQRRGALSHAAHTQALGGQRTGCAGADGGKLRGERGGASAHLRGREDSGQGLGPVGSLGLTCGLPSYRLGRLSTSLSGPRFCPGWGGHVEQRVKWERCSGHGGAPAAPPHAPSLPRKIQQPRVRFPSWPCSTMALASDLPPLGLCPFICKTGSQPSPGAAARITRGRCEQAPGRGPPQMSARRGNTVPLSEMLGGLSRVSRTPFSLNIVCLMVTCRASLGAECGFPLW